MKMKSIIINCLILVVVAIHAQNPSRFPIKPTSAWKINFYYGDHESTHTGDELFKYMVENDTLINFKKYYKLYKSGVAYYDFPFSYNKIYTGAIRDEDNRFYYVKKNTTDEVLLYDFNLTAGDSIYSEIEQRTITIYNIDTLQNGRKLFNYSKYHKLGKCGYFMSGYFIEGIGSLGGLLQVSPCDHIGFRENFLICYSEDNKIVYQSNQARCNCDIVTKESSGFSLDTSMVWKITKYNSGQVYKKYYDFLQCDTTIESKSYFRIFESGFYLNQNDTQYYDAAYVGCIRNSDNKFYFIAKNESKEVLLYNFNMKQGDVIEGLIGKGNTVTKIDTILDNRKVFSYGDGSWGNSIIEGIGSVRGLLEQAGTELNCFSKSKVALYHNYLGTECLYSFNQNSISLCRNSTDIFNGSLLDSNNPIITIYPVPAKDKIIIEFFGKPGIINSVELCNILGIKVLSKKIENLYNSNKLELNINCLEKGIYFVKINELNSFCTQKIVVE